MRKHRFCIKCQISLRGAYDDIGNCFAWWCPNEKCKRYGLLTIVWIEDEGDQE